jgi:hypothetical protein
MAVNLACTWFSFAAKLTALLSVTVLTITHTQFVLLLPVYRRVGLNVATINVQQNTVKTSAFFVVFYCLARL